MGRTDDSERGWLRAIYLGGKANILVKARIFNCEAKILVKTRGKDSQNVFQVKFLVSGWEGCAANHEPGGNQLVEDDLPSPITDIFVSVILENYRMRRRNRSSSSSSSSRSRSPCSKGRRRRTRTRSPDSTTDKIKKRLQEKHSNRRCSKKDDPPLAKVDSSGQTESFLAELASTIDHTF